MLVRADAWGVVRARVCDCRGLAGHIGSIRPLRSGKGRTRCRRVAERLMVRGQLILESVADELGASGRGGFTWRSGRLRSSMPSRRNRCSAGQRCRRRHHWRSPVSYPAGKCCHEKLVKSGCSAASRRARRCSVFYLTQDGAAPGSIE